MTKFHPTDADLLGFVEGTLAPSRSLLVSAHCDMCSQCCTKLLSFTDSIASEVFHGTQHHNHSALPRDYISMFESITSDSTLVGNNYPNKISESIELEGRIFMLPTSLSRFVDKVGEWSHLVGKLWQAPVETGGQSTAHLLYMEKGGSMPEHTHIGSELTLVIKGQFEDGDTLFTSGDFIALNDSHTHAPICMGNEGCLIFTVIDHPLHFTAGWAKITNPLSMLYCGQGSKIK